MSVLTTTQRNKAKGLFSTSPIKDVTEAHLRILVVKDLLFPVHPRTTETDLDKIVQEVIDAQPVIEELTALDEECRRHSSKVEPSPVLKTLEKVALAAAFATACAGLGLLVYKARRE